MKLPGRLIDLRSGEWLPLAGAFSYFFFVLASYYTVRPLRDALAVAGGVSNMQYLFTATFVCMLFFVPLYGWITARLPRRIFLPLVYSFFMLNLLAIYWAFASFPDSVWLARGFFVWVSVFNLFVIPVFWSFMADIWTPSQARRLFGVIAAGGSLGAISGPALVSALVGQIGIGGLPLLSAGLLGIALAIQIALLVWSRRHPLPPEATAADPRDREQPMGGSVLAGAILPFRYRYLAAFCGFMFLATFSGALLYFLQAQVVSERFSDTTQIAGVFARLDLIANSLTIVIQILFTAGIVRWLGIGLALALLPVVVASGFGIIAVAPSLMLIAGVQAVRRAVAFGIGNPVAGMLFTVVGPQSKYKFKQFADTVVYRAGDSTAGWVFTGLMALGAGISGIALLGIGAGVVWCTLALWIGRRYQLMRDGKMLLP